MGIKHEKIKHEKTRHEKVRNEKIRREKIRHEKIRHGKRRHSKEERGGLKVNAKQQQNEEEEEDHFVGVGGGRSAPAFRSTRDGMHLRSHSPKYKSSGKVRGRDK